MCGFTLASWRSPAAVCGFTGLYRGAEGVGRSRAALRRRPTPVRAQRQPQVQVTLPPSLPSSSAPRMRPPLMLPLVTVRLQ